MTIERVFSMILAVIGGGILIPLVIVLLADTETTPEDITQESRLFGVSLLMFASAIYLKIDSKKEE